MNKTDNKTDNKTFTKRLYQNTKDYHQIVDSHPFVQLIRKNPNAAKLYINFNKICIYKIESAFSNLAYTLLQKCYEYPLEHS